METATVTKSRKAPISKADMGAFFGKMYSFNTSLKMFHWHVTGKGSYAQHMALDQALESLADVMDRLVETSYAMYGDISISIPRTDVPDDIIQHCEDFYYYVEHQHKLFPEDFTNSIIDDYQEAVQQLLYRLKRLQ